MSSRKLSHTQRRRGAFTIIELLVALTITAAISAMMVTIVTNVLGAWSRSSATLSTGNQARLILDQVAVDLQGALLLNTADVTFAATIPANQTGTGDASVASASWGGLYIKPGDSAAPNGSLLLNPADRDLTSYRFGQAGVWLRFFTVPANNSTTALADSSAPRAVAYQLLRRQVGSASAPYSYQLFRSEANPYSAPIGRSVFGVGYDLFGNNAYNNLVTATTEIGDASVIRRPENDFTIGGVSAGKGIYVLGNGVIDFGVRVFTRNNTNVLEEAFPVDRRGGGSTVRRVFAATTVQTKLQAVAPLSGNFAVADTSYGYPAVVEVMLRILTPEGVQIIQAYEDDPSRYGGASASKWWELAEANSKVYVRRVEIRSRAL